MPWYYCYAKHGGGHMGYSEVIHWEDRPLREKEKESLFDDLFGDLTWPIGKIQAVSKLTEKEKKEKLRDFRHRLEAIKEEGVEIRRQMRIVQKTPTQKRLRPEQAKREAAHRRFEKYLKKARKENQATKF